MMSTSYLCERIDRVFPGIHVHTRNVPSKDPRLTIRRIRLYGEGLRDFVDRYDLASSRRHGAIPKAILCAGKTAQGAYLRSLFQADGTVRLRLRRSRTSDVVLSTSSLGLAGDVQTLLMNLGIYSRVQRGVESRANRATPYHVSIGYAEAREQFRRRIGFVSAEKESKLAVACSDRFPGKHLPAIREEAVTRLEFAGLMWVYDIQTESGQYLSNNVIVHNCFILSVEDDLVNDGGIMDLMTREARLFKYGSGTGTNYSKLRSSSEPLSGGGVSSGLALVPQGERSVGLLHQERRDHEAGGSDGHAGRGSPGCLQVHRLEGAGGAQGRFHGNGKQDPAASHQAPPPGVQAAGVQQRHRRTAATLDPRKNKELARAIQEALQEEVPSSWIYQVIQLAGQGIFEIEPEEYTTDWDGEAYNTVSGQSSNNSLRLTDTFMKAVLEDGPWDLVNRTDGKSRQTVKAREIWERIAMAAWLCADPGVQFHTTINDWHTCPQDGEIRASNPCSEYMFLDDTACNLASLNLHEVLRPETGEIAHRGPARTPSGSGPSCWRSAS